MASNTWRRWQAQRPARTRALIRTPPEDETTAADSKRYHRSVVEVTMHFVYFVLAVTGSAAVLTLLLGGGFQALHNYQTRHQARPHCPPEPGG
jgi:hypothetical protein